ncbi:MAG: glycosylase [Cyclobacteriaceae bacterium]
MKRKIKYILGVAIVTALFYSCKTDKKESSQAELEKFPKEMVQFSPIIGNPVFSGTNENTWDQNIRERGYILNEDGLYRMWYTGYNNSISEMRYLGYATSKDGVSWERYPENPLVGDSWVEDMHVVKHEGKYIMLAEGRNDIAHLLTSEDGIEWKKEGNLVILQTNGEPIEEGPYGTPTLWIEEGKYYMFYERNDLAIWLATSTDLITWTNVQDDPVLNCGPEEYDKGAVAVNQIIKHKDRYYMYYHASTSTDWMDPGANALWSSNVAVSDNLIDWEKYPNNPIVEGDHSSPILVWDSKLSQYVLYTMHDQVFRYEPVQ